MRFAMTTSSIKWIVYMIIFKRQRKIFFCFDNYRWTLIISSYVRIFVSALHKPNCPKSDANENNKTGIEIFQLSIIAAENS